ncbi:dUTP diphosphatase [Candidatus Saccharibacteria bacterium]|nr:dUTP diphosphatase [Candidatus Saccharibacteria bacterium]
MKIEIIRLKDTATLPTYQTDGAAGMDIRACLQEPVTLQPMERRMIPAGFAIALPDGYEAQIRARSGLSIKHGITMVNGVGTIDADYRGEVGVLLINLGQEPFEITPDLRIAQLVIARYERAEWTEVKQLSETMRGSGGFGSTGQ